MEKPYCCRFKFKMLRVMTLKNQSVYSGVVADFDWYCDRITNLGTEVLWLYIRKENDILFKKCRKKSVSVACFVTDRGSAISPTATFELITVSPRRRVALFVNCAMIILSLSLFSRDAYASYNRLFRLALFVYLNCKNDCLAIEYRENMWYTYRWDIITMSLFNL